MIILTKPPISNSRYRRDALVLHAGSERPVNEYGYSVSCVLTPPRHRGLGYAGRMLSLLHYALAPHVYPYSGVDIEIPPSVRPAAFSTLYSNIGNYYERCGPCTGEPGWKIVSPISTIWKIPEAIFSLTNYSSPSIDIELLSAKGVNALLALDIPDWSDLPRAGATTYVAFAPSAALTLESITWSAIHPLHSKSPDTYWGAHIPFRNHFITWAFDYDHPRTLLVTRLKADVTTLPTLLLAALRTGERKGCQLAEAWNMPEDLREVASLMGGMTGTRDARLPALKWYGPKPASNIVWVMNEAYVALFFCVRFP
jgi:hypothetical protein